MSLMKTLKSMNYHKVKSMLPEIKKKKFHVAQIIGLQNNETKNLSVWAWTPHPNIYMYIFAENDSPL